MDLQTYLVDFVYVVNTYVIPFLIGMAFLFFTVNALRFFIIGGGNDDAKEKARMLALYSVLALVFIIIFWGIINLFTNSLGLSTFANPSNRAPCSDYDPNCAAPPYYPPGQTTPG